MFGKRSQFGTTPAAPPPQATPAAAPAATPAAGARAPEPPAPMAAAMAAAPAPPPKPVDRAKSDEYYQTKSTIFGALIEAIDLSQLSKLDSEAAREEIRDIVNEIIALKNVVMSIAEQEELLDDICNDVSATGLSSRCWRATTSPTSWSTALRAPTSKSAARSSSPACASAMPASS